MADRELRRAVGRVARFLRDYQGFTQSEVAERAAIPGTSWMVSKLETAKWADSRMWETLEVVAPGLNTTSERVRKVARRMLEKQRVSGEQAEPASFVSLLVEGAEPTPTPTPATRTPAAAAPAAKAARGVDAPSRARQQAPTRPAPAAGTPERSRRAQPPRSGARTVVIPEPPRASRRRGGGRSGHGFGSGGGYGSRRPGMPGTMLEVPVPAPAPEGSAAAAPPVAAPPAAPPAPAAKRAAPGRRAAPAKPQAPAARPAVAAKPVAPPAAAVPSKRAAPAKQRKAKQAPGAAVSGAADPRWAERLGGANGRAGSVLEMCQRYAEIHLLARLEDPPDALDLAEVQELIRTLEMLRALAPESPKANP